MYQVEAGTREGAHAADIARILGDFGLKENKVNHGADPFLCTKYLTQESCALLWGAASAKVHAGLSFNT